MRAAQLCRERVEEMAVATTLEQGKPIAQSRVEILRGRDIIEWDAAEGPPCLRACNPERAEYGSKRTRRLIGGQSTG